ncbi:395_t:CDS:2 [Ambispora gerdemannii]|uniref:395_t:CDS:1 n=1 Tax=Ambispora gerdemannii TaxID=144530 RepID=A0A9N8ZWP6_9GLOM|nr:395_t:CDS:2 [Ambispora gerdemannii]
MILIKIVNPQNKADAVATDALAADGEGAWVAVNDAGAAKAAGTNAFSTLSCADVESVVKNAQAAVATLYGIAAGAAAYVDAVVNDASTTVLAIATSAGTDIDAGVNNGGVVVAFAFVAIADVDTCVFDPFAVADVDSWTAANGDAFIADLDTTVTTLGDARWNGNCIR